MADTIRRVKDIAQDLIGCCAGSRSDLEQELDELGVGSEHAPSVAFDEVAFLCSCCGWYCSIDEANDTGSDWACDDCAND